MNSAAAHILALAILANTPCGDPKGSEPPLVVVHPPDSTDCYQPPAECGIWRPRTIGLGPMGYGSCLRCHEAASIRDWGP